MFQLSNHNKNNNTFPDFIQDYEIWYTAHLYKTVIKFVQTPINKWDILEDAVHLYCLAESPVTKLFS